MPVMGVVAEFQEQHGATVELVRSPLVLQQALNVLAVQGTCSTSNCW
jgi:hypothetical protein